MASGSHETVADFDTAESFRMTMSFGTLLPRLLPLFVLLAMLFTVIGYIADLGGIATGAVSAACAAPVALLVVYFKKLQFDARREATTPTIAPSGLTLAEPNPTTKLSWDKARKLGYAGMRGPLRTRTNLLGTVLVAIGSPAARRRDSAIIGAGRLVIGEDAPPALRTQIRRNEPKPPVDPRTGRPQQAVPLQHFDRDRKTGRIGDRVRAYRPDLLG